MPRIRLTISSDMFDISPQEATIRENLPVRTLLAETRKEFNLPEDASYSLRDERTGKMLEADKTLEQQNIQTGAQLVFNMERRAPPRQNAAVHGFEKHPIGGMVQPYLREQSTGHVFEIQWQPAIIGRPDPTNTQSVQFLAVDLGNFEGSKSVSRYHARISEEAGKFYVESLADHNPAYLNKSIVRVGERRLLEQGDLITVGKINLVFGVRGNTMRAPGAGPSSTSNAPRQ